MAASHAAAPVAATPAPDWAAFVKDVQQALLADGLDAWLLYDFRGSNPIAADITAVSRQGGHLATRRWYYLIPAHGEPIGMVHRIERDELASVPGEKIEYSTWQEQRGALARLVAGKHRIAMQYSPMCAVPYVSLVEVRITLPTPLVRAAIRRLVVPSTLVFTYASGDSYE